jgi:hypothetical protein
MAVIARKRGLRASKRAEGISGTPDQNNATGDALRRSLVSPSRDQHGLVAIEPVSDRAGAMKARAVSSLERMRNRGQLSQRQANAGARLYEDWAIGICCARDADGNGSTVHDPGGYADRQLDAATRYRKAREAVGARMWRVTFMVCCEEWTLERFANEYGGGTDRKGWAAILRLSLDTLADFYGFE